MNSRAFFPGGWATLAVIEVGWADALHDSGAPESEIKLRRAAALDTLNKGLKQDPQNVDLILAQADYYRSVGSSGGYSKAMKKAQVQAAGDPRTTFIQGLAAFVEDDSGEKALPLLKTAAGALKDSARMHFRYAQALVAAKQTEAAVKEL